MDDPKPNQGSTDFVTTSEAGRRLGVSQRTVHYWIERGVLRSWKTAGGHCRVSMESINRVLARRETDLEGGREPAEVVLLLVEDDVELMDIFRQVITSWALPIRLVVANNGFEGLIQAGLNRPMIIISDLIMPAMDGFEMIRSIYDNTDLGGSLIIVVTGLAEEEIDQRGGLPEGVRLFHKPAPFRLIRDLLLQWFEGKGYATPRVSKPE
ncbi:MAG: response regulator [Magnetococcales bacterium]|nr:response regulator [Magnetococcales bacterium]